MREPSNISSGSGSSTQGLGMVYFLIPVPYWSNASAFDPACKSLGIGVADSMVHQTFDPDEVSGCAFLKFVKDDDWHDMVKKVMKLRGNTVLLPPDILVVSKKFDQKVEAAVYSCEAERAKTK